MKDCFCDVPMRSKEHALIEDLTHPYIKFRCGRDAEYKVGNWNMCRGHKEYLADPNKWIAVKLEEDGNA
jgi:hypothetical protein